MSEDKKEIDSLTIMAQLRTELLKIAVAISPKDLGETKVLAVAQKLYNFICQA